MDFVEKVVKFNELAGTPNEFDKRKAGLYIGLCLEEMAEVIEACGHRGAFVHMVHTMNHWSTRFKEGDFDHDLERMDRVGALDGFIDTAVVALGGAYAIGADVNGAAHEVADSNLSKFYDENGNFTVYKDANGKVKKGPKYFSPKLEQYLK